MKNLNIEERKFDIKEMLDSDEVFITSATSIVTGITEIDGKKINNGKIGSISKKLRDYYFYHSM